MLSVFINNQIVLSYDKNTRHPGKQCQFMDTMDLDMNEGIEVNGEIITNPDKMQRANYVVMSLLYGIENKSEGMISATCGYLVNRLPELKQIRAVENGQDVTLDLIFDEVN
jgi:hypothetical protein